MISLSPEIMPNKKTGKLFQKNGKDLKDYKTYESVTSLINTPRIEAETTLYNTKSGISSIVSITNHSEITRETKTVSLFEKLKEKPVSALKTAKEEIELLKKQKVFMLPSLWIGSNIVLSILIVILLMAGFKAPKKTLNKYSIFSSKPLVLGASSTKLFGGSPQAATLDRIFEIYNCPLAGQGKKFVQEAEKNGIPYWIVPAISFQESSCGKKTPEVDGEETYNAWGWGVWGEHTKGFDDWGDGIETVSKYLGDNFFSKGVTDPCEIMKIYTPPSNGSWCEGVKFFGSMIENYRSPDF